MLECFIVYVRSIQIIQRIKMCVFEGPGDRTGRGDDEAAARHRGCAEAAVEERRDFGHTVSLTQSLKIKPKTHFSFSSDSLQLSNHQGRKSHGIVPQTQRKTQRYALFFSPLKHQHSSGCLQMETNNVLVFLPQTSGCQETAQRRPV